MGGIDHAPWIRTASGGAFHLLRPVPEMIEIGDIAMSLARLCRFTGHCREFYSVAQHSLLVAELLRHGTIEVRRWGLLHDAAEAYVGDVASPLKRLLRDFGRIEAGVAASVAARFGLLPWPRVAAAVKAADRLALAIEARDLMGDPEDWPGLLRERARSHPTLLPLTAGEAEAAFLAAYRELWGPES